MREYSFKLGNSQERDTSIADKIFKSVRSLDRCRNLIENVFQRWTRLSTVPKEKEIINHEEREG